MTVYVLEKRRTVTGLLQGVFKTEKGAVEYLAEEFPALTPYIYRDHNMKVCLDYCIPIEGDPPTSLNTYLETYVISPTELRD